MTITPTGIDAGGRERPVRPAEPLMLPGAGPLIGVFAQALGVDLTTGSKTPLFVVPAGRKCAVLGFVLRVVAGVGSVSDADCGVGTNAAADNMIPSTTLGGIAVTDDAIRLFPTGPMLLGDAAETIDFEVDVPAGASILDVDVDLVGYLI